MLGREMGMDDPVRCLACGTLYDVASIGELPAMCPRRYLSPHGEDFMTLVAEALQDADALEGTTRAQHEAAIQQARERYEAP